MKTVRQPAVAGSFYPAEPVQLTKVLANYLNEVSITQKVPHAIIVPHAGYIYSGAVAASAYAQLEAAKYYIHRVVVIGPAHRVGFEGVALTRLEQFATPLGHVDIDIDCCKQLAQLPFVGYLDAAHQDEHSLEVQLPFLQVILHQFVLVPLLIGYASAKQIARIIDYFWQDKTTLIVISSDLSHFHDYPTAQKLDAMTSKMIEQLHDETLTSELACGYLGIRGLLMFARNHRLTIKTVDLRNSADTARADKSRVVGYGAYISG